MKRARTGILFRWLAGLFLLLIAASVLAMKSCATFGGSPSAALETKIQASPQFSDGAFVNVVPQSPTPAGVLWNLAVAQISGDQIRVPPSAIPVVTLAPESFTTPPAAGLRSVWFGHSSVLLEMDGLRFMVDPVFSLYASPVGFAGPKRFHPTPVALQDMPPVDAVMISHDHYDHLDMNTVRHLASTGTHFYVPLGIGADLQRWGVPQDRIHDMQWWDIIEVGGVKIVSTPNRHYSGRDLFDYKKTLWSSWSIIGPEHRVYYSGDTGYSDHFKEIGQRYGPFDLTIIKVGAYGPSKGWLDVHMTPEQAVDAHGLLGGRRMLPVHWATFNMAHHDWDEPIKRTLDAAGEAVDVVTPRVGEVVSADRGFTSERWWEQVK